MTAPHLRDLTEADQTRLARAVMRRQGRLSLRLAAVFLVLILGLPVLNATIPEFMNTPWFGGFTPTWLLLAVFFYPITVGLSFYFVAQSDKIEAASVDWQATLDAEEGS